MNRHLTEQQILEWAAGTPTPESRRHVDQCARCGAEVERLESAVRGFAVTVRQAAVRPVPSFNWAAGQSSAASSWMPAWRPAMAALALLLLATPLMFHFSPYPQVVDSKAYTSNNKQPQLLERERADIALLEQVDAAVARPVPQPIEPLVQLVAWGSKTNSGVTE
ncbi:MAG: hypothetical protein ABSH56_14190 [Bryobacteraceae bacterium]|jgi:hypothetical protein